MHTMNMMPPQYIGFAEDMMLILFLVCILATLVTVHRATCYRQFQVLTDLISTDPPNCPRRLDETHLCVTSSQLPRTDLRPILTPGFLLAPNDTPQSERLLNWNCRADDTVDGIPEVVCSGSLPKRVRARTYFG